jgi:hypothetical protein
MSDFACVKKQQIPFGDDNQRYNGKCDYYNMETCGGAFPLCCGIVE